VNIDVKKPRGNSSPKGARDKNKEKIRQIYSILASIEP
jgi:hypothetical protein